MAPSTTTVPTWQGELVAQRDVLNSRVAAARSAGASADALRTALLEMGPGADHLARTMGDPAAFAAVVPVLVDAVSAVVVRRAWHESSADRWALLGVVPFLPRAMGRSPKVTVDVVVQGAGRVARGADLGEWGRRFCAADAHLDDDALRAAAAVAAWRSGFVRLRGAALAAAGSLPDAALVRLLDLAGAVDESLGAGGAGGTGGGAGERSGADGADGAGGAGGAVGADSETSGAAGTPGAGPAVPGSRVSGHGTDSPRDVLARSAADPFWWPGAPAAGRTGQVGGFRGSGGPWVGVPVVLGTVEAATPTWRVAADDQVWVVVADVHGTAVLRESAERSTSTTELDSLLAAVRPDPALVDAVAPHLGAQDTVTGAGTTSAGMVLVSRATSYRLDLVRTGAGEDRARAASHHVPQDQP